MVRSHDLADRISSVALIGSLARGDFVQGRSDVDILLLFKGPPLMANDQNIRFETIAIQTEKAFRECAELNSETVPKGEMVDFVRIPSVHLQYLIATPLNWQPADYLYLATMFGLFGFDMRHWMILEGEDFRNRIPLADWKCLIPAIARSAIRRANLPFTQAALLTWASSAIRLAQVAYGVPTLDKRFVMNYFDSYVPDFELKWLGRLVWRACSYDGLWEKPQDEEIVRFGRQLLSPLVEAHLP